MQNYQYSREIKLLLINQSEEKVEVLYNSNPFSYKLPLIGLRSPYYINPRYEQYFPKI